MVYRIPKEGTLIWFDTMAIPVDAPHPEAARAFIDYMLKPESIAELTNALFFANANRAATPLLDEAARADAAVEPVPHPVLRGSLGSLDRRPCGVELGLGKRLAANAL